MRRLFVVGVLLAMMIGLSALQAEKVGGADPLTLATIGFVVLAAFALAELGSALGLPKVTGYILAGVTVGPYAANIMSSGVVQEIRMFNTLALGLIATTAGLELDLGGLRKLARSLGATIALKIVLGVLLVGSTLFLLETQFEILGLADTPERMAIALVFAALSLGTSPAIALAIISESKAKGRLSDLVLGAAIVKDVVVVVCLAIAVATAKALTGGGAVGIGVLVHVGKELGASILAGSILGALLIAYLRWVKAEMLLFVAAMVLVVAEVSAALHLELLLVFIVAGLIVRNFSKYEHDLLHPLETVSLPVFIVFFTNAGASVDLGATFSVLPLALAVCAARAVGYIVAGNVGGKFGGETPTVRRVAWLGYLPQAGVTLGLIGLASGQLSDTIGPAVATLGMAVVAVNLLAGPITMRVALRSAGEIPDAGGGEDQDTDHKAAPTAPHPIASELEDPGLAKVISAGVAQGQAEVDRWVDEVARPRIEEHARQVIAGLESLKDLGRMRRLLSELQHAATKHPPADAMALFSSLAHHCQELPDERRVALEEVHRKVQPGDGRWRRWRKRIATVFALLTFRFRRRTRRVPLRLVARTKMEPRLVELAAEAQAGLAHFEVQVLTTLEDVSSGSMTALEGVRALQDHGPRALAELARRGNQALATAYAHLAETLAVVDTPALPVSKVRYSSVDHQVRDGLLRLQNDAKAWPGRRDAAWATVAVVAKINASHRDTAAALEAKVTAPLERGFLAVAEAVSTLDRRLDELSGKIDEIEPDRLVAEIRGLLPKPAAKALRSALSDARKVPTASRLIEPLMPEVSERTALVSDLRALATDPRPAVAKIIDVPLRERVHARIEDKLIGPLEAAFAAAQERLDESDKMLGDALGLLEFLHRGVAEGEGDDAAARKALRDGCAQTRARLAPLGEQMIERGQELRAVVDTAVDASYGTLLDELIGAPAAATQHAEVLRRPSVLGRTRGVLVERVSQLWEQLTRILRGEAIRYTAARERRFGASRFDPADMRDLLLERHRARTQGAGPPVYEQLFSSEPVRDPMLFVAHRRELESLVQAERTWDGDKSAGNAVLVLGDSGSGKSSMLAVGRMKVGLRQSVLVGRRTPPERDAVGTAPRLLDVLAHRIGCDPTAEALPGALAGDRTLIAIDDLHTWLDPSEGGLAELRQLLALVEATSRDAFWLVAIDRHAFGLLDRLTPLRGWFAQVVELDPVGPEAIREVVTARHRPTGASLDYPEDGLTVLLRRQHAGDGYFEMLARRCRGNLRRAIELWATHAKAEDEHRVTMSSIDEDEAGLVFWPSLDIDALATLAVLLRSGARTPAQLDAEIGTDTSRAVRMLLTAGLLRRTHAELEVDERFRDDVEIALRVAGLLERGGRR